MIKNRTFQLVFQTFFCAFAIIGIPASMGLFDYNFKPNFYVQFTNLSNYFCICVMLIEFIQTLRKNEDSFVSKCPKLKFIGVLSILLTFVVYNFLFSFYRKTYLSFKVESILFHIVLPIMYILDWFLFYEKKKVKWYYPLLSCIFPILYIVFIYIRAWYCNFDKSVQYLYPYFFLDLEELGLLGVVSWLVLLLFCFIVVGYVFLYIDRNKKVLKTS